MAFVGADAVVDSVNFLNKVVIHLIEQHFCGLLIGVAHSLDDLCQSPVGRTSLRQCQ